MKCIYCQPNFEFIQETHSELLVRDIVSFKTHLSSFAKSCSKCAGKDLICLIGRSGSGKSTIANLLLENDYYLVKNSIGGICLEFGQPDASKVSSSLNSVTAFPVIKDYSKKSILIDFPGFFETRSGGLQLIQHILLHELLPSRKLRIILVKDIRVERDLAFVDLLNQPWVSSSNTLVVFTRVDRNHSINLEEYCEGKLMKKIPFVSMKIATRGKSFANFQKRLAKQIQYLTPEQLPIRLEISAEVFKFQETALKLLFKEIDLELYKVFESQFPNLIIQPYDISYLRDFLNSQYALSQILDLFKSTSIFSSALDITILSELHLQLDTLNSISSTSTVQSLSSWSPSSSELFISLHNRLNTFNPPSITLPSGTLLQGLNTWHDLARRHCLEHVSFQARALVLTNQGAYQEVIRLCDYRNIIFNQLFEIWKQIETVLIKELDSQEEFLTTMRFGDARDVFGEILRFSSENQRDIADTFRFVTRRLAGFALADGALATGAFGARLSGYGAPPVSTTTAAIFAATAVVAIATYVYHTHLKTRQMEKVRAIGFDFSFLKVELYFWNEIRIAAQRGCKKDIVNCFQRYEGEFRFFMQSTQQGVRKAKRKLKMAKDRGIDVAEWEELIVKVGKMSETIFQEMKARANSTPGCYFAEHDWAERSLLSFKFSGAKTCCSLFVLKPDLECRNCKYLCHSGTCQLNALQFACKSLIAGQDVMTNTQQTLPEIKNIVSQESKRWAEKNEVAQAAALCEMVYNNNFNSDDDIIVGEEGDIKYLISFSGTIAFVIIRGTEMLNISNWITNASALMAELSPKSKLFVHSGYLHASEKIYEIIWNKIRSTGETSDVVFSGRKLLVNVDSLGGAIASVLHLKLLWDKKPVRSKSVAFGSPMLYDHSVLQWLQAKNYNSLFKTFCNQLDLVPGIMLGITDGLTENLIGGDDISILASATVGILSREVTKYYVPVGQYVFLEFSDFWETFDSETIISRLQQNRSTRENVKFHEIGSYREKLSMYLSDDEEIVHL